MEASAHAPKKMSRMKSKSLNYLKGKTPVHGGRKSKNPVSHNIKNGK